LTASSQPATHELSATVSPSTSAPAAKSLPASNKLWGVIPDQTTGVAGMAVSFRWASVKFIEKNGSVTKIHWPHKILWQGPLHFHYRMWSNYFLQQSQDFSAGAVICHGVPISNADPN